MVAVWLQGGGEAVARWWQGSGGNAAVTCHAARAEHYSAVLLQTKRRGDSKIRHHMSLTLQEHVLGDDLDEVFKRYDTDGNGTMDTNEFAAMVSDLGHTLKPDERDKAMVMLDSNNDHTISLQEFKAWWISPGRFDFTTPEARAKLLTCKLSTLRQHAIGALMREGETEVDAEHMVRFLMSLPSRLVVSTPGPVAPVVCSLAFPCFSLVL